MAVRRGEMGGNVVREGGEGYKFRGVCEGRRTVIRCAGVDFQQVGSGKGLEMVGR